VSGAPFPRVTLFDARSPIDVIANFLSRVFRGAEIPGADAFSEQLAARIIGPRLH